MSEPWTWADVASDIRRQELLEFWRSPWLHQRRDDEWCDGRAVPPNFPPGYRVVSTCAACPYSGCPDCSCRAAWLDYLTPPRKSRWANLIARVREEMKR